jgi:acyl carrier protein
MTNTGVVNNSAPTPAEIEQAVVTALSRTLHLPAERVRPSSRLYEDLGLDSMAMIHVNVSVEEHLRCALSVGEAPEDELRTVQDVVDFVALRVERSNQEAMSCRLQ